MNSSISPNFSPAPALLLSSGFTSFAQKYIAYIAYIAYILHP